MQVPIHDKYKTETKTREVVRLVPVTVMKEITEIVTENVPALLGTVSVYTVQYRNYPDNKIHIQHAGKRVNRDYGFAFNIPGQAGEDVSARYLPSLAGTSPVYVHGSLVITPTSATLVGVNDISYNVPLNTLPF